MEQAYYTGVSEGHQQELQKHTHHTQETELVSVCFAVCLLFLPKGHSTFSVEVVGEGLVVEGPQRWAENKLADTHTPPSEFLYVLHCLHHPLQLLAREEVDVEGVCLRVGVVCWKCGAVFTP